MATWTDTPFGTILIKEEDSQWFWFKNKIKEKHLTFYGYRFNYEYVANPTKHFEVIAQMWNHVAENYDYPIDYLISILENNKKDIKYFSRMFSDKAIDNIYQHLQEFCGVKEYVPVSTKEQQTEFEHLGRNCIIVSRPLQRLLLKRLGSLEEIKQRAVRPGFEVVDVSDNDKRILYEIVDDINHSYSFATKDRIKICTFDNDNYCGLHSNKDGTLYINKSILNDYKEMLITLVHEFAHDFGVDGTKAHLDAIQIIFSEIVERKRNEC